MLLAVAVFVIVVGAIVGAYYAATSLPGVLEARRLNQRLQDVAFTPGGPAAGGDATVVKTTTAGPLPELDRPDEHPLRPRDGPAHPDVRGAVHRRADDGAARVRADDPVPGAPQREAVEALRGAV